MTSGFILSILIFIVADPWNLASTMFRPAGDFFMELHQADSATGDLLVVMLSGRGSELWGTWEKFPAGRVGRVQGRSEKDGDVELTFWGNFRRSTVLSGRFSWFRRGISGEVKGADRREGASLFVESGKQPISLVRVRPNILAYRSVSSSGEAFGDGASFRLAGLEIFHPRAMGESYALRVRYGMDVPTFARMKFDESMGNAGTGIRRFNETTSPFSQVGLLFSTITYRETLSAMTGQVASARYHVFSLDDGSELVPESLVRPGQSGRIGDLLTKRAEDEASLQPGGTLRDAGLFADSIPADGAFFICRSGIGFGYDRFRLAPHAAGDFRFVIPWKDLREMLLPDAVERYGLAEVAR